ncbi:ribulose-phosphate 3-epimerase [Campylobacter sp. 19-13652]|uniref:ribulose-phosphate 3-epimerase n=1 Tax=Campylobacter sp. 19-13652 TaxID=2840180 RepID=UPI001C763836|nr:ribulose-phosphate 3-epimerase [Campylobacter sp. 19-13652]BCX79571.1 ribulose-phosphate 3-epimerase [Campylobacter sp. 19-13652]
MYVAPSILSADFGRLNEEIAAICDSGADLIHVDVMDGHFVPNLTIGPLVVEAVAKVATKPLDIHLMVENIPFFVDLFLKFNPKFITFHIEEEKHPLRLIQYIRDKGISPGIVLNPHTPVSTLEHIITEVDMVLLMSVNPGFGGQKFMPVVYEKIRALRELIERKNAKCLIEVDGGVNGLNAPELDEAGADVLVAGNYIFSSSSYEEAIRALKMQF